MAVREGGGGPGTHPIPPATGPFAGVEIGGQCQNGTGVVTQFGATLLVPGFGAVNPVTSAAWNTNNSPTRKAYDAVVRSQSSSTYGGWLWYQHWWTEELRSTVDISGIWNDFNTSLLPQGTTNNKLLGIAHANLFWSPVAFVDFGVEYAYGHRVTISNFKGDSNTVLGEFRVRF